MALQLGSDLLTYIQSHWQNIMKLSAWCRTDAIPSPEEELEAARAAIERAPVPSRAKTGQRAESQKK
jgi:hypothetical protein